MVRRIALLLALVMLATPVAALPGSSLVGVQANVSVSLTVDEYEVERHEEITILDVNGSMVWVQTLAGVRWTMQTTPSDIQENGTERPDLEVGMVCRIASYDYQEPWRSYVDPDNCYWPIVYSLIRD